MAIKAVRSSVFLGGKDKPTGIVVLGTRDLAAALSVARLDVRAISRDIGFRDCEEQYAVREDTGRTVWWYRSYDEKGCVGVRFDVGLQRGSAYAEPSPTVEAVAS